MMETLGRRYLGTLMKIERLRERPKSSACCYEDREIERERERGMCKFETFRESLIETRFSVVWGERRRERESLSKLFE